MVPLGQIDAPAHKIRTSLDGSAMTELVESIRTNGVLTPILVVEQPMGFRLVVGLRRFLAACQVGIGEIPAMVVDADEARAYELSLIENIHRENLNPYDEAVALQSLMRSAGKSADRLARDLGKNNSYVYNRLKLLRLGPEGQHALKEGLVSIGDAVLATKHPEEVQRDIFTTKAVVVRHQKVEVPSTWRTRAYNLLRAQRLTEEQGQKVIAAIERAIQEAKCLAGGDPHKSVGYIPSVCEDGEGR